MKLQLKSQQFKRTPLPTVSKFSNSFSNLEIGKLINLKQYEIFDKWIEPFLLTLASRLEFLSSDMPL